MSRKPIPNFVNVAIQAHSVHVGVLVVKGETSAYHPYHPRPANQFILDDWLQLSHDSNKSHPANRTEDGYRLQTTKHQIFKYSLNILKQIDNLKPIHHSIPKDPNPTLPNKSSQFRFPNLCKYRHTQGKVPLIWYRDQFTADTIHFW